MTPWIPAVKSGALLLCSAPLWRYRGAVSTATGIRQRNRADLTAAILASARQQLADKSAAELSLRAIARELGMASSAIYRYFPSRDALLTQLIIDAYNSLADHVQEREARVPRSDRRERFRVIGRSVRSWALAHEHEYALIYGTPVPGYAAPQDTIGPASRVTELLLRLLVEAEAAGADEGLPRATLAERGAVAPILAVLAEQGATMEPELMIRGLMVWTLMFGAVSFELFGHVHKVVAFERTEVNPFFDAELERMADYLGIT